ncbi:hypothetical protein HAX54_027807, partial [Datura stramonium]|nr:hypothetical protein [Datura stramonium]
PLHSNVSFLCPLPLIEEESSLLIVQPLAVSPMSPMATAPSHSLRSMSNDSSIPASLPSVDLATLISEIRGKYTSQGTPPNASSIDDTSFNVNETETSRDEST